MQDRKDTNVSEMHALLLVVIIKRKLNFQITAALKKKKLVSDIVNEFKKQRMGNWKV